MKTNFPLRRLAPSILPLALGLAALPSAAQKVGHPLDPLNFQEYWRVLETLREAGRLDAETRFSLVNMVPPPKPLAWEWKRGESFPRKAFALARQGARTFKAVVDLRAGELISWKELQGIQPNWLLEEHGAMQDEIKGHPDFLAAMKARGIDDTTFIDCRVGPPGYYGTDEQRGRRVGTVTCTDARHARNRWTRGIEGLTAVVDMEAKKVLRVVDEGAVPLPDTVADYDPASIGETREVPGPMRIDQPLGAGFEFDGSIVEWQNWRFHVRHDQRVGLIVSTVTYRDGGRERRVLYEGYLSEMFVPYMDPSFHWYQRNFLDMGEFSRGGIVKPLLKGLDCPRNAVYIDGMIALDNGRPQTRRNTACIFERETGDMAWRHHTEAEPQSRKQRDLVVRAIAVVGNYDYVFDWIFLQNGSIRVRVGASGEAEAKIVEQADASSGGEADAYGRFVDRHIVAVNHDHYFNFRLDLDVDGTRNSFVADRLVTKKLPADHPRRSLWTQRGQKLRKESEAKLNIDLRKPVLWRVVNAASKNRVGYPASYQLAPGRNSTTLLTADDYPRRRAGFLDYHLWVTPYDPNERWAAGEHPTLSEPGQGLPKWTSKDRGIDETDLVLWHSIGMQHVVRAEDWPVMPVAWRSFELRPFDFFDRNPALDLPVD